MHHSGQLTFNFNGFLSFLFTSRLSNIPLLAWVIEVPVLCFPGFNARFFRNQNTRVHSSQCACGDLISVLQSFCLEITSVIVETLIYKYLHLSMYYRVIYVSCDLHRIGNLNTEKSLCVTSSELVVGSFM